MSEKGCVHCIFILWNIFSNGRQGASKTSHRSTIHAAIPFLIEGAIRGHRSSIRELVEPILARCD
jgi:hypothetical protein